jgi:glyoxylase-like metal-dependent hydrolase (beta-lactamase superfamily II)
MSSPLALPSGRAAKVHVLFSGYVGARVASTVVYVRDGDVHLVVDPGMVPDREAILRPLAALGVAPDDIAEVILSHHHPDHTLNAALFPRARFHDFWAIYQGDRWIDRAADGYQVSPSARLMTTPGHTPQDITTLIGTNAGIVACTHLWWSEQGPPDDPLATDQALLHMNRGRVLDIPGLSQIIPGHGAPFVPTAATPR